MNLRTLTLKYLGWCPGVKEAARFMPERDIPGIFLIGSLSAVILLTGVVFYSLFTQPLIWAPRVVFIDGIEYPDEHFNESFDYSSLKSKDVVLHQPFNPSEFLPGGGEDKEFAIPRLDDIDGILEEFGTPSVVIGYALWIGNSTWDDVVRWWYGDSVNLSETIGKSVRIRFGDSNVFYEVERRGQSLTIGKWYKSSETKYGSIWKIEVSCNSPHLGTIFRRGLRSGRGI